MILTDIDPYACEWSETLVRRNHLPPAIVVNRDVRSLKPGDLPTKNHDKPVDVGRVVQPKRRAVMPSPSLTHSAIHPTQKPEDVTRALVEYSVEPGEVVLDLFAGSGTTLVAAKRSGRRAIGIEQSLEHVEDAARRLAERAIIRTERDRAQLDLSDLLAQ